VIISGTRLSITASRPFASFEFSLLSHATVVFNAQSSTLRLTLRTPASHIDGVVQVQHTVLANGKTLEIRQNLYDFLDTARNKAESESLEVLGPYWIDALTIDQANNVERNHQVAQMGMIFSNAIRVDIWLGELPPAIFPFKKILRESKVFNYDELSMINPYKEILEEYIVHNEYWSRAWITQEIILARHIVVWLDTDLIGLKELIDFVEYLDIDLGPFYYESAFSQFARNWRKDFTRPKTLFPLLAHFRDRQCHDPRDRIFSLLSLVRGEEKKKSLGLTTIIPWLT
jgi:hypothetical protein